MSQVNVQKMTCARIPTDVGDFQLCFYQNSLDDKEHLALLYGDVSHQQDVLVRIHSECFTGDVLGSLRCDCGPQLHEAMQMIANAGAGAIIYLRQEGRGIGLLDKLRAYNLQDQGYDTVEANIMLGHQADARDYTIAALILQDLGIDSLRLITNNPAKIEGLDALGIHVHERVALQTAVHPENEAYLSTKVERMRHMLSIGNGNGLQLNGRSHHHSPPTNGTHPHPLAHLTKPKAHKTRPAITLSYAQSLDGSISAERGHPLAISGPESMSLTHQLRADHDAILVGIGTILADNPRLSVRLVAGDSPQPIILDSSLRFPTDARLLQGSKQPWIFTTQNADIEREHALTLQGARVIRLPQGENGRINLKILLNHLATHNINSVMVEGGAQIITSFLAAHLVDRIVLTIAPMFIGGLNAVSDLRRLNGQSMPHLTNSHTEWLGKDMVLFGDVVWEK
ncbi:MAG: GTP cyclohydrolase II [Chloroflexi bacterium]|nr:GTP cyclohydrolase II [Chloroflexota bacterium]